jgi:hypothetical protein
LRSAWRGFDSFAARTAGADRAGAEEIASVQVSGRTLLTETKSKRLLALYRIPFVPARVGKTDVSSTLPRKKDGRSYHVRADLRGYALACRLRRFGAG